MKSKLIEYIDFEKVNNLLEGFNKATGFVTAILDLDGNILSKSGWRQICTEFHRVHPESAHNCRISDTNLANSTIHDHKVHYYQCLNGLIDVAVPLVIHEEHIANLFTGQFFFEKPDIAFFKQQAERFGFDEAAYMDALNKTPVVSKEKVQEVVDFLLNMTQLIAEMTLQKLEQENLNDKLQESENQYRNLANLGMALIWTSGTDKLCNYFNEPWLAFTGRTLEQEMGNGWTEGVHPDDFDRCLATYIQAFDKREPFEMEYRLRHVSGEYRVLLDLGKPNFNSKGAFIGYIGHCFDITERKKESLALAESEENLSITLRAIGDGVISTDLNGFIVQMNPVAEKLCGWSFSEATGKPLSEVFRIVNSETRKSPSNQVKEVLKTGRIVGLVNHTLLISRDGNEYHITNTAAPIKNNEGEIIGVVLVFSDATEKIAAEKALRASEERFRIAQEMSPDGFTILQPIRNDKDEIIDFVWVYENQTIARINGTEPQQVIGKRVLDLFPSHLNTPVFDTYLHVAKTGETQILDEVYVGTILSKPTWLRLVVVSMGEDIAILGQDITDRKIAEKALRQSEQHFAFLTRSAAELAGLNNINEIYQFAAEKIFELLEGEALVAAVEYNHDKNKWKIQHLSGFGTRYAKLTDILGFDLKSFEGEISTKYLNQIITGGLSEIAFDFPGLFNNKLSDVVSKAVKKLLGIHKMYCIGFKQAHHFFGNLTFTTNEKTPALNTELIEAFIAQVSSFVNRNKAEQERLAIESQYRAYVDNAPLGIFVADRNGNYQEVNNAACQITGYSTQELVKKNLMDVIDKTFASDATNHFYKVVNEGKAEGELLAVTKSGEKRWWHVVATKISEDRFLGFCTDISERKQLNKNLLNSEANLKAIVENTFDSIWSINTNYEITYINEVFSAAFLASFGVTLKPGSNLLRALPEQIQPAWKERYDRVLQGERVVFDDVIDAAGAKIYIEVAANPIIRQGKTIGASLFGRDVTERKQIEESRNELIERFQLIGSNLDGMIYQYCLKLDGSSHFPYASEGIEIIYGLSPESVKDDASQVFKVLHPDDLEMVKNSISSSAENLKPWHAEYRVNHPAGKTIWVEGNATPQKLLDGSILWHGYIQDVSERKKAETIQQLQYNIARSVLSIRNLNELYDFIKKELNSIIDSENLFIALYNEETGMLSANVDRDEKGEIPEWPAEKSLTGYLISQNRPLLLQKNEILALHKAGMIELYGTVSEAWLGAPLKVDGKTLGAVVVQNYSKSNAYDQSSLEIMELVANELSIFIDRQRSEEKSKKLSRAVEQSSVSVIITNKDGAIEYINPFFSEISGYSFDEVKGNNPNILKSGHQSREFYKELWDTINAGNNWEGELLNKKKTGEFYWERAVISPVFNSDGLITNFVAIKEDVTEKKLTEEKLLEAHRISKLGTYELDLKHLMFQVSANMSDIYGFTDKLSFSFEEWQSSLHPDEKSRLKSALDKVLEGNQQEIDVEFRIIRKKDQELRWIHAVGKLSYNENGEAIRLVGTSKDITDIKNYEQKLIEAKEIAEENNRLKTAFLQNLSHEVRTPLNGIIGFSELINDPDLSDDDRKRFTDIIIERGWQLTSIINDILTVSAIETGQEKPYLEKTDIRKLINNHLEVYKPKVEQNGLKLRSNILIDLEKFEILADKPKIGQILNNLFNNAIKFTGSGYIELGCSVKHNILEFYVKDTGIGIDKRNQSRIFERFAQADDSIRLDYGGTGLGLSICKGFVEMMGGNIWVNSAPYAGSTFYFTVPFIAVEMDPNSVGSVKKPAANSKKYKALVAEDDENNFLVIALMLESINIQVLHAKNGKEAYDMVKNEQIDLVFMDIKMPVLDGYAAALLIRKIKPDLPIIAQTAHAAPSEIRQYGDAFDAYLTKPFTREKITKQLQQLGFFKE